jgi:hypothetical protein
LCLQVIVERIPGREPRDRHHEVARASSRPTPPRCPCRFPCRAARSGGGKGNATGTRLEERGPLARSIRKNLRNQTAVVVVEGLGAARNRCHGRCQLALSRRAGLEPRYRPAARGGAAGARFRGGRRRPDLRAA